MDGTGPAGGRAAVGRNWDQRPEARGRRAAIDAVAAIAIEAAIVAVERRLELFHRAAMMRGRPRERVAAIGIACEVYVNQFPELFRIESIIRHDAIWEKTSSERQEVLRNCEGRCMHTVAGVVRDAVAGGDLELARGHGVEDIVFGLWSLVFGGMLLELTSPSLADVGIGDPRQAIRRNCPLRYR